jgi:hypothetical protein
MPLNEIRKFFSAETCSTIDAAVEDAWQELRKNGPVEAVKARRKLARTIVALAAVGETDTKKLKWFAIHAWRGALQAEQGMTPDPARISRTAA